MLAVAAVTNAIYFGGAQSLALAQQQVSVPERAWLGVRVQDITGDMAAALGFRQSRGAFVNVVTPTGPAARAGLKDGDTILEVNGTKITGSRELTQQIANYQPSTNIEVKVLRDERERTIPVMLGKMPNGSTVLEGNQLGLATEASSGGAVITKIDPYSDANQKGLRVGDLIEEIGGQRVSSSDDVSKAVNQASRLQRDAVLLRIKFGNQTRFVAVQIKKG